MPVISSRLSLLQAVTLENCACAAILAFFAIQGAVPFIAPNQALEVKNVPGTGLIYWGGIVTQVGVYTAIGVLLCTDLRRILRWIGAMRWSAALCILAVASSLWSQFPLFTLRRSIPFALAALFGLFLAVRFSVRKQLSILFMAMIALTLATIALAVCFPQIGLDANVGHGGNWQGVFTSKNACGRIMVLATAVTLSQNLGRMRKLFSVALFLFVIVMSGSHGAWLIEAMVLALYPAIRFAGRVSSRSRLLLLSCGGIAVLAAAVAAATHIAAVSRIIGRDATLTGRTEIWRQVWPFILQRPWLGWGYAGFWHGLEGESFRVAAAMRFMVIHAHNGFLEIGLELGAVGLLLFVCSYFRAWRKLWPRLRSGPVERITWMLFVLVLIAAYDLDENTLLIYNGLFWVIYVATLVNIEMLSVEENLGNNLAALFALTAETEPSPQPIPVTA